MARIIGVEVPSNKRIDIALRYIYGIGPTNAVEVLERANIDPSTRAVSPDTAPELAAAIRDRVENFLASPDVEFAGVTADDLCAALDIALTGQGPVPSGGVSP